MSKKSIRILLCTAVIMLIGYTNIFRVNIIQGESMMPTLKKHQLALGSRLGELERGDIIVAERIDEDEGKILVIKRIVGLPGETVYHKDGKTYINGEVLEEPYAIEDPYAWGKYEIGEDEYFICGDNRENSYDSRYYGPIKASQIKQRIFFKGFN